MRCVPALQLLRYDGAVVAQTHTMVFSPGQSSGSHVVDAARMSKPNSLSLSLSPTYCARAAAAMTAQGRLFSSGFSLSLSSRSIRLYVVVSSSSSTLFMCIYCTLVSTWRKELELSHGLSRAQLYQRWNTLRFILVSAPGTMHVYIRVVYWKRKSTR